jgi:hypothetical protein
MFAFVCPIRHPSTSNNYLEVTKQLALTIESVCAQNTTESFKFIVVCNKVPELNLPKHQLNKVIFVPVDFPVPENKKGTAVSLNSVKFDKGTKIAAGLLYLQQHQPEYVYVIDGDDWINTNIIETVKGKNIELWYANSGYIVNYQNQTYIKKYGVCRYCGSTFIYKYKTLMQLSGLDKLTEQQYDQAILAEQLDDHILRNILGNHRHQLPFYQQQGFTTKALPIAAVSWILNTGENHTGQDGGEYGMPLSKQFLSRFGLTSFKLAPPKISAVKKLLIMFDSIKSWFGWRFTNKSANKI